MKILYLTGDTRVRASAFSLFLPLYHELIKNKVDIIEKDTFKKYPNLRKNIFNHNDVKYLKKYLHPDTINDIYDVIVIENLFPYWNEDWHKIKAKKIIILGDLHRFNPKGNKFPTFMFDIKDRVGISAVFTKYIESYEKNYEDVNLPVYHWPHSINPELFYNRYIKKEYDILSTGMLSKDTYPIRNMLYELLKNEPKFKRIDRPHNRTDIHPDPWPISNNYVMEINKAKISIACTSTYHYTIAKIFEIPACNSVLLCDYTEEMKQLGYIPDMNFIECNKTIEEIRNILHDQEHLEEICNKGYKLVHEQHTTQQRVKEFLKYCRNVKE